MRTLTTFRQCVVSLEPVPASAEIRGGASGEFIAGGEEQLRTEALQERPPAFVAWQSRTQRTDALSGHNRNQAGLPRQGERALVAGRVRLTDSGEGVVLVADE